MSNENLLLEQINEAAFKKGLPLEILLEWINDEKTIVVGGQIFNSVNEACKAFKIEGSNLYKEAKSLGVSASSLLKDKVENQAIKNQIVVYKGEEYKNFSVLCRHYNQDPQVIQSLASNKDIGRIAALELALTTRKSPVIRPRKGKKEIINGIPYNSRREVYRAYKITSTSTIKYMENNNCTFEEAVLAVSKSQVEVECKAKNRIKREMD